MISRIAETANCKYRILHYVPNLGIGGAEKQLVEALRHMDRDRFWNMVCYGAPPADLKRDIEELGIPALCLGVGSNFLSLRPARTLQRVMRENCVDLLHVGLFPSRFGFLSGAACKIPVVTTLPNTFGMWERAQSEAAPLLKMGKTKALYAFQAWLAKRTTHAFIAISEAVKQSASRHLSIPADRIDVIHRGLLPEAYSRSHVARSDVEVVKASLGLQQSYPILLNTARLVPQKGQKDLLLSMPKILEQFPTAKLLIAGDGPLRPELEQTIYHLGLGGRVFLLGRRADIKVLLHACDAFVFASYFEGFGNAIIEAMAAGVAVFAFRLPCLEEIVEDGASGFLVDGHEPGRLAQAVAEAASRPDLMRQMGLRGQQIVKQKFDIRRAVVQQQDIYDRILTSRRPPV